MRLVKIGNTFVNPDQVVMIVPHNDSNNICHTQIWFNDEFIRTNDPPEVIAKRLCQWTKEYDVGPG